MGLTSEKKGTSQRELAKTFKNILKEAPQVWIVREIPPSQGILLLAQVVCLQSSGGQKDAKSHNIAEPSGESQFKSPVISQLAHKLYLYQRTLVNGSLTHLYSESLVPQRYQRG